MALILQRKRLTVPPGTMQLSHDPARVISDASAPQIAMHLYKAFLGLRAAITPGVVHAGMANGGLWNALAPAMQKFVTDLGGVKLFLANAHLQTSNIMGDRLRGVIRKETVQFDLDTLPQPTVDALDGYDYGAIQQITDDVRQTISQVISRGITEGWAPAKMARQISGSIGLTTRQEQALNNYRTMLENGDPDALDRQLRDPNYDPMVDDATQPGAEPLAPDMVDRLVGRYEDRYVSYRANTIARYESLRAANQGSSDAVQSSIDDGTLDPSQVITTWMIAPDEIVCDKCRSIVEIQPDGVPFGTPFEWRTVPATKRGKPHGGAIMLAPLHPLCRCTNNFRVQGMSDEAVV